jgi:hypothetical protein
MQIFKPFAATAVAAGLALAGGAAIPAAAQDAPEAVAPAEFSDAQLEAFAQAAVDVAEIRDEYAMALNEVAEDDEAAQEQLVEEGNAAMLAAVEDNPAITLDEYLEIGEAAAADPELGERISMLIQDMIEG